MSEPLYKARRKVLIVMERSYRRSMHADDLIYFRVVLKETDLYIGADRDLYKESLDAVTQFRRELEAYIALDPTFQTSLVPITLSETAPQIAVRMAIAALSCNVGPMAAVAGAFSQMLAEKIGHLSKNLLIENGGDLYLKTDRPRVVSLYAGENKFKDKIKVAVSPGKSPLSICSSSGTFGHSLSFGKADAVTIFSENAFLADAAATSICNDVRSASDISSAIDRAMSIKGITGVIVIIEDKMGICGDIELV